MAKVLHSTGSVVIARPPSEVYAFFSNPENETTWRPGVKSIQLTGDPGIGAVYRQTVAGPGGRSVRADFRMTALDPDTRVAFVGVAGPVRPKGEFHFAPEDDGTRVTFTLHAELGGLKALVMGGMVGKTMDAEVAALSKAKAHLEGA